MENILKYCDFMYLSIVEEKLSLPAQKKEELLKKCLVCIRQILSWIDENLPSLRLNRTDKTYTIIVLVTNMYDATHVSVMSDKLFLFP